MEAESEPMIVAEEESIAEALPEETRAERFYRWVELLSAVVLALATIATAWSGYQSARWSGEQAEHQGVVKRADVQAARFANIAEQRLSLHVGLFGQWAVAISTGNQRLADFTLARFPEPLKAAATAWLKTDPLNNLQAPASPFNMPEYALFENSEVARWEAMAVAATEEADLAGAISDRYLLFTIIFASVLFFGGISGKFRWPALDVAVLVLGGLALLVGVVILITSPIV